MLAKANIMTGPTPCRICSQFPFIHKCIRFASWMLCYFFLMFQILTEDSHPMSGREDITDIEILVNELIDDVLNMPTFSSSLIADELPVSKVVSLAIMFSLTLNEILILSYPAEGQDGMCFN